MTSIQTQLPKDYYRLPFCQPIEGPKMASENLGEFLTGNKIQDSPYQIHMLEKQTCKILCQVTLNFKEAQTLRNHIFYGYHNNWIIDNLPSVCFVYLLFAVVVNGVRLQTNYFASFPFYFFCFLGLYMIVLYYRQHS